MSDDTVIYEDPTDYVSKCGDKWYKGSENFWATQDPSDSGMLAGFTFINGTDICSSNAIVEKYQKKNKMGHKRAADCGCGVGRVTYLCLSEHFDETDLIDPIQTFLDTAVKRLDGYKTRTFATGIQNWIPDTKYDCIWCQWSIMYLTDDDAVAFLKRAKEALDVNGLIFIKDNISSSHLDAEKDTCMIDTEDNGLARCYKHYLEIFEKAGLKLVEAEEQENYPKSLLPLYTFVLK